MIFTTLPNKNAPHGLEETLKYYLDNPTEFAGAGAVYAVVGEYGWQRVVWANREFDKRNRVNYRIIWISRSDKRRMYKGGPETRIRALKAPIFL